MPGVADEPGLGCGRADVLALGLGWVLGNGGVVCAEARCATSARSTGMAAGCCARPLAWLRVCVRGCITAALVVGAALGVGAGLSAAEDTQAFVAAWRVPCTPVSSMLTAP